ncbi:LuxR family transcriptional regulator [Pantoea sp. Ap-967]|uniref:helix-turn-helix transcriptional regulator n=1 Tax=Pantoea sp. Ap-967 TaxID=2608362 RepID=UPI00141FC464|nr:LuxR family transcriptional regulator [Pantoea sp. Ap-967]NIE75735.1 LuxR family transcriptional regulator [Pantoea sp. Ap-967]
MDSRSKPIILTPTQPITHLHTELQTQLSDLDNLRYAYYASVTNRNIEPIIISNYPSRWVKDYKSSNSHLIDPIINHGLKKITPFSWQDALACSTPEGLDFFQRATRYQICSGVTFTLRDACGMFCALSLCDAGQQADFDRRLANKQGILQMLLIDFHDWLMTSRSNDQLFLPGTLGSLSVRELGVLQLVVRGKSYREIATDCGISERTVKFHMSNIAGKLQVANAKQAVYEAKRQGII